MTGRGRSWLVRLQLWSAILYVIGLAGSITLWQYSLVAAIALTAVRWWQERQQRILLLEQRWFFLVAGLYYAWSGVSAIVMNSPGQKMTGLTEDWTFLAVPVIWSVLSTSARQFERNVLNFLAWAIVLTTVAVLLSYPLGFDLLRPHDPNFALNGQASGLYGTSLTFAECFLALGLLVTVAAIRWRDRFPARPLLWLASGSALCCIVLSGSRIATALALFVSWGLVMTNWTVLSRLTRSIMLIAPVALVALSLASSSYYSLRMGEHLVRDLGDEYAGSRRFIWSHTIALIEEHPVFGVGPGEFSAAYGRTLPESTLPQHFFSHAHNDLLQIIATRGIIGGIFYLIMWGMVVRRSLWLMRRDGGREGPVESFRRGGLLALAGLLLCGMTEAIFSLIKVRGLIMLLWGLVTAPTEQNHEFRPSESVA